MTRYAQDWIERLGLQAHPDGGYFRETYRSAEILDEAALPERYRGPRHYQTAIYFLLASGEIFAFHRMQSDELWFFHAGSPVRIHCLYPDGSHETVLLGADPGEGQSLQAAIPRGVWFGAEVTEPASFVLVSCTVAPGFEFMDFELADREALRAAFPDQGELVARLTPALAGGGA